MTNNRFETAITVKSTGPGPEKFITTAEEAMACLLSGWAGKRGPKHREALQACQDVLDGKKPLMSARRAFLAAAREAGLLVPEKPSV